MYFVQFLIFFYHFLIFNLIIKFIKNTYIHYQYLEYIIFSYSCQLFQHFTIIAYDIILFLMIIELKKTFIT